MAGVDTSIYSHLLRPVRSVADYRSDARRGQMEELTLQGAQDQRAAAQQQRQRADQLQALMQGMGEASDEERVQALRGGAFFDQADALEKGIGERAKTAAAVGKDKQATEAQAYDLGRKKYVHRVSGLSQFESPEDARQWLADGVTQGAMSMKEAQRMMGSVPRDPAAFAPWRDQTIMSLNDVAQQAGYLRPDANARLSATTSRENNTESNARQAADNAASRAVTMRGQDKVDARSREGNAAAVSKPFEVTDPTTGQPVLVRQDRAGNITPVDGFQPKGTGATKLTEDQGKATGWLAQATNAYANMQSAMQRKPGAERPGIGDAVAMLPLGETAGNLLRSSDRQRFVQSAESLSEALLRAATGAGVNKDEARQKARELMPQFGDTPAQRQQKMDAIPVYLESLKVRAGPGARQIPGIMERAGAAPAAAPAAGGFKYLGAE